MKKTLSIIAAILIVLCVGVVSYYYFVFDEIDPTTGQKVSFREFLPFGSSGDAPSGGQTGAGGDTGTGGTDVGNDSGPKPLTLWRKVSDAPAAGYVAYTASATPMLRYMERATGHIYDYNLDTSELVRVSNTTIPKVRETAWDPSGRTLVLSYLGSDLGSVESFHGTLSSSTTPEGLRELVTGFLRKDLIGMAPLPGTGKLFTLSEVDGAAVGSISDYSGSGMTAVWRSPMREWLVQPVNKDTVGLTTKPASGYEGGFYLLNVRTGALSSVVTKRLGLTAVASPDEAKALFSENDGGVKLKLYDAKSGGTTDLSLSVLSDKCAWNASSTRAYCAASAQGLGSDFLDRWYQGTAAGRDTMVLWINPSDKRTGVVANLNEGMMAGAFDWVNVGVDTKERNIILMNRNDSTLWVLNLGIASSSPNGE